ncbi:MAG: winged helix DNA-binding domain-containing protein [Acidimicrobiia bacterium]
MQRVERDERRASLVALHHLNRTGASFAGVAGDIVGLHSSDPASVFLAAWARISGFQRDDAEASLYDDRSTVRHLGMRRTMFVVPPDLASVVDAACTKALYPPQRRRVAGLIEKSGISSDGDARITRLSDATLAALEERGSATARELTEDVPELGDRIEYGKGTFGMSTRILFLLSVEGRIVRGRPNGSWLSSQYQWSTVETWLGESFESRDARKARAELLERWLRVFGPATELDCKWWTGWNLTDTRAALADIDAETVALDDETGYRMRSGAVIKPEAGSTCLLPALDPTPMGWKEREWFLGPHESDLFDRNGNIGPTVWVDGAIVGGWGQSESGSVHVRLLEPVASESSDRIEAEASALETWLDGTVVKPRFPTPLEKRLRAG